MSEAFRAHVLGCGQCELPFMICPAGRALRYPTKESPTMNQSPESPSPSPVHPALREGLEAIRAARAHLLKYKPLEIHRLLLQQIMRASYEFNRGANITAIRQESPELPPLEYVTDILINFEQALLGKFCFSPPVMPDVEVLMRDVAHEIRDYVLRLPVPS